MTHTDITFHSDPREPMTDRPTIPLDIRRAAEDMAANLDQTGVYKQGYYYGFTRPEAPAVLKQPAGYGAYEWPEWTAGRKTGGAARREWDKLAWNA